MGACCGVTSENDNQITQNSVQTTQKLALSKQDSQTKKKNARRQSASKGMTRLAMKFPHIRRSFRSCKTVFDECAKNRKFVLKSEVRPLLIKLGATSSDLTNDEIERIIKTANLDGDEKIDFKEFLIAAAVGCFLNDSHLQSNNNDDEFQRNRKGFIVVREAFDAIDIDKSGEIDFDELKTAFLAIKEDALIMERLKELDVNGDKAIEFPEFVWGLTAWVGMDPDADDEEQIEDNIDQNTTQNASVLTPRSNLTQINDKK